MAELERDWTYEDLLLAHDTLDALEEAKAAAEEKARRDQANAPRGRR